jgi:methyltransferase (TIGR00027 family)
MLDAVPSQTATATAFIRAAHMYIDDAPPVFDDHVAYDLLRGYQRRFIKRLAALSSPWVRRYRQTRNAFTTMRAQIVVRARYAEDALAEARKVGVDRFVVLAAGLDTFAIRQARRSTDSAIEVLEIDHPATQRWKRELLAERGIAEPDELSFLTVNFEEEALTDVWVEGATPDFASWLGTTYYLTGEAIADTLRTLAERTQPGSQLVLDYWREPPPTDLSAPLLWGTRVAVALQQEPMRSFFEPKDIEALAQEAGWRVRENCAPEEQNRRYLAARSDQLSVPSFAYLLHLEH